jgi:hypothetical protein
LERALKALEADRDRTEKERLKLEGQIADLKAIFGRGRPGRKVASGFSRKKSARKRRRMSTAGRKAISLAMKRRWAQRKKAEK